MSRICVTTVCADINGRRIGITKQSAFTDAAFFCETCEDAD